MKKIVLVGAFALAALSLSAGKVSAFYPCYEVHKPCWQIPLPKFPLVIPNIKFYCAECCPPVNRFAQPWYLYYPPQTHYGYSSPWFNYAAPAAYPYGPAAQGHAHQATHLQQQGYPVPQAQAVQYAPQGYLAGRDPAGQGNFAPPAYWYGR